MSIRYVAGCSAPQAHVPPGMRMQTLKARAQTLVWVMFLLGLTAAQGATPPAGGPTPTPYVTIESPRKRSSLPDFTRIPVPTLEDLRKLQTRMEGLVTTVNPSVVAIQVGEATGSGVVVTADGLILTVAHVLERPGRDVRVIFSDGRTARGKSLGTNHEMDSGLVRITDTGVWKFTEMGPADRPRVGSWTLALGHPGGFDAKRPTVVRTGRVIRVGDDFFQTDCTITAGDSGGPLFDTEGRVIGIHSRISDSTAENYHVPISTYHETWERLLRGENWGGEESGPRPWLGTKAVDGDGACVLQRVDESGPAAKAGLKVGDVVLSINGEAVEDAASYGRTVRASKVGQTLALRVRREGKELSLQVKVGERKPRE